MCQYLACLSALHGSGAFGVKALKPLTYGYLFGWTTISSGHGEVLRYRHSLTMAAFPQTVADLQKFISDTAQPAIDMKIEDAVMHQERKKDQLSERIGSVESTLVTEIARVERMA